MPRRPLPDFQDRFLDEIETAEIIGVSVPALAQDRWKGTLGIPYHKFNSRVRYRLSEVLAWAETHRVVPPVGTRSVAEDDKGDPDDSLNRRPRRRGRPRKERQLEEAAPQ